MRDGLGLHRYAELRHRLRQQGADEASLQQLAAEHSIDVARLRDVERIAREPIPALRALGGEA